MPLTELQEVTICLDTYEDPLLYLMSFIDYWEQAGHSNVYARLEWEADHLGVIATIYGG